MGERTPHLDPRARAALVVVTASHTRAHVIRAILEGVAFSLRDTLTIFAEMGGTGRKHSARRGRRAGALVAADTVERLRESC